LRRRQRLLDAPLGPPEALGDVLGLLTGLPAVLSFLPFLPF